MTFRSEAIAALLFGSVVANGQGRDSAVYSLSDDGVIGPTLVKSVKATYTSQARAARIQGFVTLEAVVLSDGKIGNVTFRTSKLWRYPGQTMPNGDPGALLSPAEAARFGLDKQAIEAAKQWVFEPGTKAGKPVAVRVVVELTFEPPVRAAR
jgi:hypothetical protein